MSQSYLFSSSFIWSRDHFNLPNFDYLDTKLYQLLKIPTNLMTKPLDDTIHVIPIGFNRQCVYMKLFIHMYIFIIIIILNNIEWWGIWMQYQGTIHTFWDWLLRNKKKKCVTSKNGIWKQFNLMMHDFSLHKVLLWQHYVIALQIQ